MPTYTRLLIQPKQAENTQISQYTAGAGIKAVIDKFTATNTSALVAALSVNLIPVSSSAGASNLITDLRKIAPGETYTFPELIGQVIDVGGVISTIADTATALTITASGREIIQ